MAGSVNKVILIGNLGREPETKTFQTGSRIVNFTLATSESWTDKGTGQRKEKTEWHNISVQDDNLCDFAEKYLRKGTQVYLEGKLQTRKWTAPDGTEKTTSEVVLPRFRGSLTILSGFGDRQESFAGKSKKSSAAALAEEVDF